MKNVSERGFFASRLGVAALASLLSLAVSPSVSSAPYLAHCEDHDYDEEINHWNPKEIIAWMTDELAQCDLTPTQRAWRLYERGWQYYASNQFDLAIQDSSEAIALDPANPYHHALRSSCYAALSQHEQAIAGYTQLLAVSQGNGAHASFRAFALTHRGDLYCLLEPPNVEAALSDWLGAMHEPGNGLLVRGKLEELSYAGFYRGPMDWDFGSEAQAAFESAFREWCSNTR